MESPLLATMAHGQTILHQQRLLPTAPLRDELGFSEPFGLPNQTIVFMFATAALLEATLSNMSGHVRSFGNARSSKVFIPQGVP